VRPLLDGAGYTELAAFDKRRRSARTL
jgi:hypothetical protein